LVLTYNTFADIAVYNNTFIADHNQILWMSKKLAKLLVLILSVPLISYRNIPDNDTVNNPVFSLNSSMDSYISAFTGY